MADRIRLDRLFVARGAGSRKEAARAIRRGRVEVGGAVVRDPAAPVVPEATLSVFGEAFPPRPTLVAWHKPVGVVCTARDPWGREDLSQVLPASWRSGLHPVGRLDQDTSGLLLFSGDGALTQHLLHPRRAIPRTYEATVADVPDDLSDRLAAGVETAEGTFTARLLAVDGAVVTVEVTEGKHRMVRRMLHNAGASVTALHRIAYGPWALGALAEGEVAVLDPDALAR